MQRYLRRTDSSDARIHELQWTCQPLPCTSQWKPIAVARSPMLSFAILAVDKRGWAMRPFLPPTTVCMICSLSPITPPTCYLIIAFIWFLYPTEKEEFLPTNDDGLTRTLGPANLQVRECTCNFTRACWPHYKHISMWPAQDEWCIPRRSCLAF